VLKNDEYYMRLALIEALKGEGRTSPNPCVGAVIVKDGCIISKGYHKEAGTPHAEVNAVAAASKSLAGATMYVTLEPCNHTGKTPPCTKLIVEEGLSRVVVGAVDHNPFVDGGGIAFLRENEIEVVSGVLRRECEEIIRPFVKRITHGVPWMIMKGGITLDGKINYTRGRSGWITGEQSMHEVHRIRDKVDAIIVGSGTVRIDNPSLTTRLQGCQGRDPLRAIIDTHLDLPLNSKLFHLESDAETWVFCAAGAPEIKMAALKECGVQVKIVASGKGGIDLAQAMAVLGKADICTALVEGGAGLHGSFLKEKLFDSARLFFSPIFAGDGGLPLISGYSTKGRDSAPRLVDVSYKKLGDDMMISGNFQYAGQSAT